MRLDSIQTMLKKTLEQEKAVDLGRRIKQLRKLKKMDQGELASKVGINSNHLSRLETGKYQPSVEVLKKIADAFEVSVDMLLNDHEMSHAEASIKNQPLAQRMKLIESLEEEDKKALMHIIDCMLTKQRMRKLLDGSALSSEGLQ